MADVTIGGKTRTLRFDLHALSELELRSEKHLGWFLTELAAQRCGPGVVVWLLWAGLLHETPPPSVADVRALLIAHRTYGGSFADLLLPVMTALTDSDLFRAGSRPNAPPEVSAPSATSGSAAGSTATSQSSTGA
jgi:hypothetical protein